MATHIRSTNRVKGSVTPCCTDAKAGSFLPAGIANMASRANCAESWWKSLGNVSCVSPVTYGPVPNSISAVTPYNGSFCWRVTAATPFALSAHSWVNNNISEGVSRSLAILQISRGSCTSAVKIHCIICLAASDFIP